MTFLDAWNEGANERAELLAGFLADGSKEKMGATFLLGPKPLAEKEADFRRRFSDESNWFAYFVIGESHLKNGYQKEAFEAYKHSYQAIQQLSQGSQSIFDKLLISQVKTRLYDLNIIMKAVESSSATGSGDQDK
jgi:hypothetical protein